MNLKSINIRKGLELEVPVVDIFKMDIEPIGDIRAMQAYEDGWNNFQKNNPDLIISDGLMYSTKKIIHKINDSLNAYVFDSYLLCPDPEEETDIVTDKTTDIEFVNTKILTLNDFFTNLMDAQAFSGIHEKPMFKHRFIGTGEFNMQDYIESHPLASHSHMHFLDFFILHKKVFSPIGFFISGLCENDIKSQKEYLTDKEYKEVMSEAKKQWKTVRKIIGNIGNTKDL